MEQEDERSLPRLDEIEREVADRDEPVGEAGAPEGAIRVVGRLAFVVHGDRPHRSNARDLLFMSQRPCTRRGGR